MKILFTKLRYKNFLSIGKNFVEIDLNTSKRTLIFGKNGKGKSTILDALVFSLFGKPFRNINKPTVVNSINKSNCVTEIEFVIGENYYKIIRGLKPTIFEIYKNGELIKQNATVKEYQILLEETILKTNYKSFIQIVILGSANYIPFMQLTASERRFIVEDLLDIQVFSTMNIIAKDRLSILKSEIDKLKFDITITQSTIDNKKQFLTTIKDNSNTQLISLENDINDFNDKITFIKQEISSLELEIINHTQSIINKIEIENQKQRLLTMETKGEGFLNKINKHINFYENYDECPTCKQSIDLKFKNEKIDHHLKRKSIIENGLKKVKKDLKDNLLVMENITNISKEMLIKEKKITELQTTINRYTDFIENLNNKVNEIKNLETNTFELESQELLLLTNKYNDQLLTKESLLQQKRYLEVALSLLKDNGIKVKLIKKYLPVLNQLINKYLSSLNLSINFNINEQFGEIIKSRGRDEFSYYNFSEGQKLKIDISLLLAFREIAKKKNSINCNLLIMDEILDSSLDSDGIQDFFELLNTIGDKTNVFIISHRTEEIQEKFDRLIKFDMNKNFTKMKVI